ncbi:hypothetical protein [Pedobacter punctiformis]|uniref:Uncharacterized protein n=1 Tax=Pedobacter punctiformis TaxID=3004097 RepID=A0ABT4LFY4_9SPHI|nr:hypothetical protein [Pedobacter sp. HCMS5-2]MCZ4245729.1 hypothetical protein [Pedobacter sp. HCMS5-2]
MNTKNDHKNKLIKTEEKKSSGLDLWNDRLDENLESTDHKDLAADEKAKAFSEKFDHHHQSKQ